MNLIINDLIGYSETQLLTLATTYAQGYNNQCVCVFYSIFYLMTYMCTINMSINSVSVIIHVHVCIIMVYT